MFFCSFSEVPILMMIASSIPKTKMMWQDSVTFYKIHFVGVKEKKQPVKHLLTSLSNGYFWIFVFWHLCNILHKNFCFTYFFVQKCPKRVFSSSFVCSGRKKRFWVWRGNQHFSGTTCAQLSSFKTCLFDASHFFLQIKVFSVCIHRARIHRNVERSFKCYVDYAQSRKKICKQTSRLLFLEKFFFLFWLDEYIKKQQEKI